MFIRVLLLLASTALLFAAACGSDDDEREGSTPAGTTASSSLASTAEAGSTAVPTSPGDCESVDPLNAECTFGNRGDVCWVACYCNEPVEGRTVIGAGRCSSERCAGAGSLCRRECGDDNWDAGNFCSDVTAESFF